MLETGYPDRTISYHIPALEEERPAFARSDDVVFRAVTLGWESKVAKEVVNEGQFILVGCKPALGHEANANPF